MSDYLIWLIVALVILGCEMMLGTIYLLAFSAGALAACISALFGLSLTSQFTIAAIVIVPTKQKESKHFLKSLVLNTSLLELSLNLLIKSPQWFIL